MAKSKILIVEDEQIFARDLQRLLEDEGYQVLGIASTRAACFSEINKKVPDLVLMDVRLRDNEDGTEIAGDIRSRFDIPVVYISAHADKRLIDKAILTEPYGYLIKPIDRRNLIATLEISIYRHSLERRSAQATKQVLQESEDRFRRLVENINEGIVVQDRNGVINYVNDRFLEMIGYGSQEVIGQGISEFLGEGILQSFGEQNHRQNDGEWRARELAWKRKDGMNVFTILSPKPLYDNAGKFLGTVAVLTDITERRKVELELKRSREELRSLSQYIHSVKERESKRIAREIHDELGQQMTALKMDLAWLSSHVHLNANELEIFSNKVEEMGKLIDQTIHTVQKISAELRPGLLDDLGLIPAMEWLAQDFKSRANINCRAEIHCEDIEFRPDVATAIFRISQEALTNVARHSRAKKVLLSLKKRHGLLELRIRDNGRGIQQSEIHSPTSLGLIGMRERIRPYNGKLEIKGEKNKGTTLKLSLPLSEAVEND